MKKADNDWFGFFSQGAHLVCQVCGSPGWSILRWAGECEEDVIWSCLEKVCLLNLLKGLPDRVTQTQFSLPPALCSDVSLFHSPSPASCSRVLSVLLSSRSCFPRFPPFSLAVDLSLSKENVVLIRHFAEPVFLGQTLLKTPQIYSEVLFKPGLCISGIDCDF